MGAFDEAEAARVGPNVIVVASDSPDRDTIESLREATAAIPRPVVMFVDRSEPGFAEAAVAGGHRGLRRRAQGGRVVTPSRMLKLGFE